MTVEGHAHAKINLALHVTGRRGDGYHLVHSLVVFAQQADRLTVTAAKNLELKVTGPFADGVPANGRNLVMKAAQLLQRLRHVVDGASITLEKFLPHGGGIGGGSSDAATALRLLAELWQVAPLGVAEALPLGADVPVCMQAPHPCFVRGVGEIVEPVTGLPEFWLVLVNPGVHVATARVFALHDELYESDSGALAPLPDPMGVNDVKLWLRKHRNDLSRIVSRQSLAPVIDQIFDTLLDSTGCGAADMSGSGSTCWGFFQTESAARTAEHTISGNNPDWWVRTSRIKG